MLPLPRAAWRPLLKPGTSSTSFRRPRCRRWPTCWHFRALYPRIETVYSKINSNDIYNRIVEPASSSEAPGDVIWSSAMDLQVKLVNDGYAQPYVSKVITHIPDWAICK